MKKYFWIFILLLSVKAFSQKITFKPYLGLNTYFSLHPSKDEVKTGLDAGLQFEKKILNKFYLETGLCYSRINGNINRQYSRKLNSLQLIFVRENFSLNSIKLPLNILYKLNSKVPFILGVGTYLKYNIKANGNVDKVGGFKETYSGDFYIKTNSGNKVGVGLQSSIRKELSIAKQKFAVGFYYDVDLSNWMYPTNLPSEDRTSFPFRRTNISLLVSMNF